MGNVMRLVAGLAGDGHQLHARTLIDQKPHDALMIPASGVRTRRSGG